MDMYMVNKYVKILWNINKKLEIRNINKQLEIIIKI